MSKYYKHPQYGRVYGEPIATPEGRAAWPSLVSPKESVAPDGKTNLRYEITILLDKTAPETDVFLDKLNTMINEDGTGMLAEFNKGNSVKIALSDNILTDGDTFDMEKYPYYAGRYVIVARSPQDKPVPIRGKTREPVDAALVKGGVRIKAVVTPHIGPTGLSFKADKVQFISDDGVRFGGGNRDIDRLLDACEEDSEADDVLEEVVEAPQKVATPLPSVVTGIKAPLTPAQIQAQLRANQVQPKTVPVGAQAVSTGKGKKLALDNL